MMAECPGPNRCRCWADKSKCWWRGGLGSGAFFSPSDPADPIRNSTDIHHSTLGWTDPGVASAENLNPKPVAEVLALGSRSSGSCCPRTAQPIPFPLLACPTGWSQTPSGTPSLCFVPYHLREGAFGAHVLRTREAWSTCRPVWTAGGIGRRGRLIVAHGSPKNPGAG